MRDHPTKMSPVGRSRAATVENNRKSKVSSMHLNNHALTGKVNFLGGVDKDKVEQITVHFVNSSDISRYTPMDGTFVDELTVNVDLETTSKILIPRILKSLEMPSICRDIFSLYVYWDDLPPRPLGPNELVLPALVWQNPLKRR